MLKSVMMRLIWPNSSGSDDRLTSAAQFENERGESSYAPIIEQCAYVAPHTDHFAHHSPSRSKISTTDEVAKGTERVFASCCQLGQAESEQFDGVRTWHS